MKILILIIMMVNLMGQDLVAKYEEAVQLQAKYSISPGDTKLSPFTGVDLSPLPLNSTVKAENEWREMYNYEAERVKKGLYPSWDGKLHILKKLADIQRYAAGKVDPAVELDVLGNQKPIEPAKPKEKKILTAVVNGQVVSMETK